MTESRSPPQSAETSLTRDVLARARYHLSTRRGIIVLAAVAVVAGLTFNWSWLVAAGIAPILLSLLPCAAMCALGLCMTRMGGRSCSTDTSAPPASREGAGETAAPRSELPSAASTDDATGDPQAAFVEAAMANQDSKPQRERRLTDA